MTCFAPLKANREPGTGKITFPGDTQTYRIGDLQIPCGRCNGCRIAKSKEWAIRCMHETKQHGDNNSFITLTYATDHLPKDASLNHEHFQKFIRSLRKKTKQRLRYYMCGEYGKATENNGFLARPHYHAIIFGYNFPDKTTHQVRRNNQVYRSEILEHTWTKGFSEIGNVTFKSCAYVARYIIKKQQKTDEKYQIIDRETGEITGYRKPEYTKMSLKPGIGHDHFMKYMSDNYEYVMLEPGKKLEVPKYYKQKIKDLHPELAERLKKAAIKKAKLSKDNTPERLATREKVQHLKLVKLKRELE